MPNVLDYLEWRGDLTFAQSPLNEVDNLVFCLLSYVDLDGIVPGIPRQGRISLRAAAAEYFLTHPDTPPRSLGLIIPADILTLFRRMARAPRYREIELTGYVNRVSEKRECQFSALTFHLPGEEVFVAFRGTDDTIVGWKEDLNLSIMKEIPSQRMAIDYLDALDLPPDTAITVGGHSKGGNLAVWGVLHAQEAIRRRIQAVYSNDGPGFYEGTTHTEAYQALRPHIHLLLPEDSLVGLLLEQEETYRVVKSNRRGLYQHDGLSWEVLGGSFLTAQELSPVGLRNKTVLRDRIYAMPIPRRREAVRLLFTLLEATGAKTLTQLYSAKAHSAINLLKAYRTLSETDRFAVRDLWDELFSGEGDTSVSIPPSDSKPCPCKGKVRMEFLPFFTP